MKIFLISIILCFYSVINYSQTYLQYADSVKVDGASIWGVPSYKGYGPNIYLTTTSGDKIQFSKVDTSLKTFSAKVTIADNNDIPSGYKITDHKHIYKQDHLYFTFSLTGDEHLYLGKFDTNGVRIGNLVLITDSTHGSNDMMLVADQNTINVVYGKGGKTHYYYQTDLNLNYIDNGSFDAPLLWPQLSGAYFKDNIFYVWGGDETQHDLVVYKWDTNWTYQTPFADTVIFSQNQQWHYFSTGIVYDSLLYRWYIGYAHQYDYDPSDHETVRLAVFDTSFNLLEVQTITAQEYIRPHMVQVKDYVYVVYDGAGSGVWIKKFRANSSVTSIIENKYVSGNEEKGNIIVDLQKNEMILYINLDKAQNTTIEIVDILGGVSHLAENYLSAGNHYYDFNLGKYAHGTYFLKVNGKYFTKTCPIVLSD